MGQVVLFSAEDQDEEIKVELSAGYDVMLDQLEEQYDEREEMINDITTIIESTIYQEAQAQNDSHELHKAFAELVRVFEEVGEIDIDSLTEDVIHQLNQADEIERQET